MVEVMVPSNVGFPGDSNVGLTIGKFVVPGGTGGMVTEGVLGFHMCSVDSFFIGTECTLVKSPPKECLLI